MRESDLHYIGWLEADVNCWNQWLLLKCINVYFENNEKWQKYHAATRR